MITTEQIKQMVHERMPACVSEEDYIETYDLLVCDCIAYYSEMGELED